MVGGAVVTVVVVAAIVVVVEASAAVVAGGSVVSGAPVVSEAAAVVSTAPVASAESESSLPEHAARINETASTTAHKAKRMPPRYAATYAGDRHPATGRIVRHVNGAAAENDRNRTARWYRRFADHEAAGSSPIYEALAASVAADPDALDLLIELPLAKRQPNLLFAAMRHLGLAQQPPDAALAAIVGQWSDLVAVMTTKSTQTNEAARTGTTAAALAGFADEPVHLVELGASAGLCLLPDHYEHHFVDSGGRKTVIHAGSSPTITTIVEVGDLGQPVVPTDLSIASRVGFDLSPLDAASADDRSWLQACIWPEHDERRDRLVAALDVAADVRPEIRPADLSTDIDDILAGLPTDRPVVVVHSAVLNYLDPAARDAVCAALSMWSAAPGRRWIAMEGAGVLPDTRLSVGGRHVVCVDGAPVAAMHPHGGHLSWF